MCEEVPASLLARPQVRAQRPLLPLGELIQPAPACLPRLLPALPLDSLPLPPQRLLLVDVVLRVKGHEWASVSRQGNRPLSSPASHPIPGRQAKRPCNTHYTISPPHLTISPAHLQLCWVVGPHPWCRWRRLSWHRRITPTQKCLPARPDTGSLWHRFSSDG